MGEDRVREARLQILISEFERLKMKDMTRSTTLLKNIRNIIEVSRSGEIIDKSKLVNKFLLSIPRKKYIHIVASLEQFFYLKTMSFEDIIGLLKTYEERVAEERRRRKRCTRQPKNYVYEF